MHNISEPRAHVTPCAACGGHGGHSRGATAVDACDRCAGSGQRYTYACTARGLAEECGERVVVVVRRSDAPHETWGCINGHRWDVRRIAGAWAWTRIEDRVALMAEAS